MILAITKESQVDQPPNNNPQGYFTCVHQDVISNIKKNLLPPKIYAYASIDIIEECPPFNPEFAIPENEIADDGNMLWGSPEHFDCISTPDQDCRIVPSSDACRGGFFVH